MEKDIVPYSCPVCDSKVLVDEENNSIVIQQCNCNITTPISEMVKFEQRNPITVDEVKENIMRSTMNLPKINNL